MCGFILRDRARRAPKQDRHGSGEQERTKGCFHGISPSKVFAARIRYRASVSGGGGGAVIGIGYQANPFEV
jgi:hypothetical protein